MALALFGSGEFTPAATAIDSYLIDRYKPRNVAVLPTAAGKEPDALKWIEMAKAHYAPLGVEVIEVPILNREDAHDLGLIARLDDADWIFFSGGDPGYLLETLRDSPLWTTVLARYETGALLAGSSAGAMAMGQTTLASPGMALMRKSDKDWATGLALIDYSVIPHYDAFRKHPHFAKRLIDDAPQTFQDRWMGIDEDTAVLFDGDDRRVLGAGSAELHAEGSVQVITAQS